jgi:small-conductance mechanosensitive channel
MKKAMILFLLIIISVGLWFVNIEYPNPYLEKGFYTFLALAIIYFLFKLVFDEAIGKKIADSKARYHLKKAISIIHILVTVIVIITLWVENPQALLVAYGIIAAGLAVSLQDVFKNLAGGLTIFLTGIYGVGDRVEINSKYGDVIDTGIFYTTLLELREWVSGDQSTGRLVMVPNGNVLSSNVVNYTKDNNFIWDEINIPITYDSDWREAVTKILDIVRKETEDVTGEAGKEIPKIEKKYYLPKRAIEPAIFLTMTDNWITFNVRYLTEVRGRRALHNKLTQILLDEIQKSGDIHIASETLDVSVKKG